MEYYFWNLEICRVSKETKTIKIFEAKKWLFIHLSNAFVDSFVNSGNTMNESFQWTDTVFRIDQVNIVTMNILKSDMQHR